MNYGGIVFNGNRCNGFQNLGVCGISGDQGLDGIGQRPESTAAGLFKGFFNQVAEGCLDLGRISGRNALLNFLVKPLLELFNGSQPVLRLDEQQGVPLLVTGGITLDNLADYLAAGARGAGIGSALYSPGKQLTDTGNDAAAFVAAYRQATAAR